MTETGQKKCLEPSNIKASRDRRIFVHVFHALHAIHVYALHYMQCTCIIKKIKKKNTQKKK